MTKKNIIIMAFLSLSPLVLHASAQTPEVHSKVLAGCENSDPTFNNSNYYFLNAGNGWLFESGEFAYPPNFSANGYLRRFIESLRLRGIEIVFLPVPRRPYKYSDEIDFAAYPKLNYSAQKYKDIWEDMIGSAVISGAHAVNLLPSIDSYSGGLYDEPYFHKAEHHWTTSGAASAAEITSKSINSVARRNSFSLEKSPYAITLKKPVSFEGQYQRHYREHCGELIANQTKLELEVRKTVEDTGLLDDIQPQLAVFGDSFGLGEEDNNFAPLLQYYSGLETVNYAIPGRDLTSMVGYLADQKTISSMPKIIVLVAWGLITSDDVFYRQMIPALHGGCKNLIAGTNYKSQGDMFYKPAIQTTEDNASFLNFNFDGADVSDFNLSIKYLSGREETVRIYRPIRGFYNYSGDLSHYYLEINEPISYLSLKISDGSVPKNTAINMCKY